MLTDDDAGAEQVRAVAAAAFDEPVAITGYMLVALGVDSQGVDRWVYRFDPRTPAPMKLALARLAQLLSDEVVRGFLAGDDEED